MPRLGPSELQHKRVRVGTKKLVIPEKATRIKRGAPRPGNAICDQLADDGAILPGGPATARESSGRRFSTDALGIVAAGGAAAAAVKTVGVVLVILVIGEVRAGGGSAVGIASRTSRGSGPKWPGGRGRGRGRCRVEMVLGQVSGERPQLNFDEFELVI